MNRQTAEALLKIKNDPTLKPFLKWVESLREESRDKLELMTDKLQVEQGKAQAYKKILDCVENSNSVLQKIVK